MIIYFQKSAFSIKEKIISFYFKYDFLIVKFNYITNILFKTLKIKSINQKENIRYNDKIILLILFEIELNVNFFYNYLIVVKFYLIFFTTSIKNIFIKSKISKKSR